MEKSIGYCNVSNTIRQYPENYMLAHWNGSCWLMEPDLASDKKVVVALTLVFMEHEHKWTKNASKAMVAMVDQMNK